MAYGHPAHVRAHRRGGPRRNRRVWPWLVIPLVLALVAGGVTAGYLFVVRKICTGEARATVVTSPGMVPLLQGLARQWVGTTPSVGGVCAAVDISGKDSAVMAQALGTEWDEKSAGPRPDVWAPDSTVWVRRASTAALAERMMPDLQPSLARTPAVVAMPKPMAEALGWPNAKVSWQDVVTRYAANPDSWKRLGKPWGAFRFGMTDPLKSTSGLLALMAMLDNDDDGEVSATEQAGVQQLKRLKAVYTDGTGQIFAALHQADAQGTDQALAYLSAFPALEQEVLAYNQTNPRVPLVAVYPTNGSGDADHPYLILNAPWVTKQHQDVAKSFLAFLRGPEGRRTFLAGGFRDSNRAAGAALTEVNGFAPKLSTLPRAVLLPESVQKSMDTWTALTRQTNVLLVLDVSGSMRQAVPGSGKNRLTLAKEAATAAVSLFSPDTSAGLWAFSTRLDGVRDYRELVSLGKLGEDVGGRSRKDAMLAAIDRLAPGGDTGLYDTMAAAQQAVLDRYQAGATNLVVLMTDGRNDDPGGGLTLDQLKAKLAQSGSDPNRKVPVITVGYGEDADFAILQELSRITGAPSYTSKTSFDISQVLLTAIFGRVG
jgi:Ca-activated chloride channel family protein